MNVGFFSNEAPLINLSLGLGCEKVTHRTVCSGGNTMIGSQFFKGILRDTRGATAIEYGLIVALICCAIIGAMDSVADENTGLWAIVRQNVTANL